jgi:hypothetical protein
MVAKQSSCSHLSSNIFVVVLFATRSFDFSSKHYELTPYCTSWLEVLVDAFLIQLLEFRSYLWPYLKFWVFQISKLSSFPYPWVGWPGGRWQWHWHRPRAAVGSTAGSLCRTLNHRSCAAASSDFDKILKIAMLHIVLNWQKIYKIILEKKFFFIFWRFYLCLVLLLQNFEIRPIS